VEPSRASASAVDERLRAARDAFSRHAWGDSYAQFVAARADGELGADDLDAFAHAAWWSGHLRDSEEACERAFAAHVAAQNPRRAAMLALDIWRSYQHKLASSIAAGWFKRAERLLSGEAECAEHAHLTLAHAFIAQGKGDLDAALDLTRRALDIATRFGDREAQALALNREGRILIKKGQVDDGMALIDEAMVAAVSGELSPFGTAVIYCSTIVACEDLADYGRAGEWTDAARRWCERKAITGFPGVCRVHRAEVMRLRGAWTEAEQEARRACKELQDFSMLDSAGEALYEIGEIRLRMGDLDGAAERFREAHALGRNPQPGLSMLQLLQGKADGALASIRRALSERKDRLARAKLLPAHVDIALAASSLDDARSSVAELEEIASVFGSPALHAAAQTARGSLQLREGDAAAAATSLRQAVQRWQEIDLPYEAARARLRLSEAHHAEGDAEAATIEGDAARAAFVKLGAALDAQQAAEPPSRRTGRLAPAPAVAGSTLPSVGDVLLDKIEILRVVGEGGMGTVFEAKNQRTGRHVAVKFVRAAMGTDADARRRLLQEALACGRIQHPNVVDVYDAGLHGETPYLVMELLRGESLGARMTREGPLPATSASAIVLQALQGIGAAHRAGIVHRDLKPDNLFLAQPPAGGEPVVKIVDFGISKIAAGEAALAATQTGTIMGTPHYMSPEQMRGSVLDARTDLYSLGAVLFHALTGREPFVAESYPALIMAIVSDDAPSPRSLRPDLPAALESVILRAMAKDRDRRFQSADEFASGLQAASGLGGTVRIEPISGPG
jgi:tetratricopeptide (TPR) repeat protein